MIPVALQLRPSSQPPSRAEAGAVLVPGAEVQVWLAEAAAWSAAASATMRLFVLPVSATDMRPAGALLVPGNGKRIRPSARAMPCDEMMPGVWAPRGTTLLPSMTGDEARRLFLYHLHLVHPALGLVSWDDVDAIAPHQLLALKPNQRGASWEMAATGPSPAPRLHMVKLALDEGDLDFLQQAGADIGSKSHSDFGKTKSVKDKLGEVLGGAGAVALGAAAGIVGAGVGALMGIGNALGMGGGKKGSGSRQAGGGAAGKPGFLDFLMQWAQQQTEALADRRHKELERLMKLLETNPAEGLRFALPLAGDSNARGYAAQAGDRLTLRNPSLGNMGSGGGVVDPWNLDNNWRWKLQQRYRELAAEEARRGRHEKAAYIYGELLGEWRLAADVLMQGGKYREAARIYTLKANNKFAAAECLEKGGLLAEAAELFAELKMHERCGDVWTRMGRKSEAFRSYLEALREANDRRTTARILEHKLHLHGWAAAVLGSGWPHSTEAKECLTEHFALLTRCRAEDEMMVQAERFAQHSHYFLSGPDPIRRVAKMALALPFQRVRERFILLGRLAVATLVKAAPTEKAARPILETLTDFEPNDALLKTDIRRFTTKTIAATPMPLRKRIANAIKPARVLNLPSQVRWLSVCGHRGMWLALGQLSNGDNTLFFGDAEGIGVPRSLGKEKLKTAWLVSNPKAGADFVGLHASQGMRIASQALRVEQCETRLIPLPQPHFALAVAGSGAGDGRYSAISRSESSDLLMLMSFESIGKFVRSRALGWAEVPPEMASIPFACVGNRAFMALGNQVFMLDDKDGTGDPKLSSVNLPGIVTSIVAAKPSDTIRIAVAWGNEVVLLSPEKKWEPVQLEVCDTDDPLPHFLPDGNLIIAGRRQATVMSVDNRIETLATLQYSRSSDLPPKGVMSLDISTCAILLPDGRLEIFKVEQ